MSKLRSDELVNMEGDGAPSFPQGATSIEPTADNQVATKLYVDSALSAASGNAVSDTAPTNPAAGSFWTDTSVSPSILKTWNGSMWIEFAGTAAAAVGVVVSLPSLSATNLEHAPATITASGAQVSNATLFITKWYKDDVEIVGATGSTYVATEPGVYRYEESWADNAGNILTPSLNKTIQLLAIEAPSITSPVVDSGVPDFDYTAVSSAITNIDSQTTLDDFTHITSRTGQYEYIESDQNGSVFVTADVSSSDYFEISTDGGATWSNSNTVTSTPWLSLRGHCFVDSSSYKGFIFSSYGPTGSGGDTPTFKSAQGNYLSWSQAGTIPSYSSSYGRYDQIATDNNGFIVAAGSYSNVAYSTNNADSWTRVSPGSGGTADSLPHWSTCTYFAKLGKFVISTSSLTSSGNRVYLSGDTSQVQSGSWTIHDSGIPDEYINDTATNDDYLFASTSSSVWRTSDLTSWTKIADFSGTDITPNRIRVKGSIILLSESSTTGNTGDVIVSSDNGANWVYKKINSGDTFGSFDAAIDKDNNIVAVNDRKSPRVARTKVNANSILTLTDTTVSKVSDGSLVGGESIDQVLTVGETVQADVSVSTTVATPVFSATTYTGNGSTQTIDTGIDLDAGGGLIWIKKRGSQNHCLQDTEQGLEKFAASNASGGFTSSTTRVTGATSTGYTIGNDSEVNESTRDYASWTFREAPAFFDVVTYTGQYTYPASYAVPHSLGSVPGMIIIKKTSNTSGWTVWHKGLSSTTGKALSLHSTPAEDSHSGFFPTAPNSSEFYLGDNSNINSQNQSYVAYVFADTPGLIKCGTYTGTGSSQTIDTGFKPKFVLTKSRSHSSDWYLMDSENPGQALYANGSNGQQNVPIGYVNNGFTVDGRNFALNEIGYEYIYLAIAENPEVDFTSDIYASGTVSASSGNSITLSDVSGTWSTGMKVQGVVTDTKDYPDPIDASAVTFASSEPVVTSGTVNTWDYAEWNLSYDAQFSTVVHEKAVPLTATGTQAGPDSFPIQAGTEYFVRTKYASSLPSGQSDWSAVTRFLTKPLVYADDVFSTYLYAGNGSTQTIDNGIDFSGEGGLVWIKQRNTTGGHFLVDTERGRASNLNSTSSAAAGTSSADRDLISFNNNGFTVGPAQYEYLNASGGEHVSWSFRKAPGFFDVVTYTGNGSVRTISHNLGSVPGMIICKRLDASSQWPVWHRSVSLNTTAKLQLEESSAAANSANMFTSTAPTSTEFTIGTHSNINEDGGTYVAYIFAHDDARFGANGDAAIIKCDSYTGETEWGTPLEINLGFEPQFVLIKDTNSTRDWIILDAMRGWTGSQEDTATSAWITPNTTNAESEGTFGYLTPTGFVVRNSSFVNGNNNNFIYMAIRRPHKPATVATDVFNTSEAVGTPRFQAPFVTDMMIGLGKNGYQNKVFNRLTGTQHMELVNTNAETTFSNMTWDYMDGAGENFTSSDFFAYMFRRTPGFFDTVIYSGNYSGQAITHNLGVAPELMIIKVRDTSDHWEVYDKVNGATNHMRFDTTMASSPNSYRWNDTEPTSTVFTVGSDSSVNNGIRNFVAYLFASLDGISKVGSYTGTGGNINVDCGFTAGSRFVLIKRTDSTGDWYVWDAERGIVSGNDPYTLLNTTDAQVTGTDYIDPFNAGFTVNSGAPAAINASGGTYLFLAIA